MIERDAGPSGTGRTPDDDRGRPMEQASDMVREFFEDYERGINASDLERIGSKYNEYFIFTGPRGPQVIKRDDLLEVLPRRQEFFKTVGLTSSKVRSLEETRLDDNHVMVKAYSSMKFEEFPGRAIVDETSATYVLYRQGDLLRIVFQLDHQDLMKRVQDLGLWSAKD
jgi:hypothetical protein